MTVGRYDIIHVTRHYCRNPTAYAQVIITQYSWKGGFINSKLKPNKKKQKANKKN